MKNILRLSQPTIEPSVKNAWISQSIEKIFSLCSASQVILFGSAIDGRFDHFSDLDFVILFKNEVEQKYGQSRLHQHANEFPCPIDFICTTEDYFLLKRDLGGVLYIANATGRVFNRES